MSVQDFPTRSPTLVALTTAARVAAALTAGALVAACSGGEEAAGGHVTVQGGAPNGGDGDGGGDHRVSLTDAMNYAFDSSLAVVTTRVRAKSDITFDWSRVTRDMLGRELDPVADVDMLQLMLWRYDEESFLASINDDELETGRIVAMGYCDTEHERDACQFLELVSPGGVRLPSEELLEYVDPATYPPSEHAWVMMLATGSVFGHGTRLLAFLEPSQDETRTTVRLTNDSTTLSYTVDLTGLEPISIPQHAGDFTFSWVDVDRLTSNGMGATWIPTRITDVEVSHYQGFTVADLEKQFLRLDDLASEHYGARLNTGQEVRLSELEDEAGQAFSGIDDDGIWLFSLMCSSCRNPAPWFLSILSPSD